MSWKLALDMLVTGLFYTGLGGAALWAFFALWFFEPWSEFPRRVLALCWLVSAIASLVLLPRYGAVAGVSAGVLMIAWLWSFHLPSINRDWSEDQARLPLAVFNGDKVFLQNLRHARYRDAAHYDITWYTREFDLDELVSVDFIVEPFGTWRALAHTFLSFGFADGEHLAVSVEIRKQKGERYSPFKGLFRQYEIMYVIGDERDLIGLRANIRKHPVYLYPIRATPEQLRALFTDMLRRANTLARAPEFYNTLGNTCSSNIVRHMDALREKPHPFDLRVLFPGYADEIALELGLIDAHGDIQTLRERYLINPRSAFGDGDWSAQIRQAP